MVENKKYATGQSEFAAAPAQSNLLGAQKAQPVSNLGPQQLQQGGLTFVKVGEQVYDENLGMKGSIAPMPLQQQSTFVGSTTSSIPIHRHGHEHHKPIIGQQQMQPLQQEFGSFSLQSKRHKLLPYGWQESHVISFPKPQFLFRTNTKWRRPTIPLHDQLSIHELKFQCQQELLNKWSSWNDRQQDLKFGKKQWKPIMDKCIQEAALVGTRVVDMKFNRAGLPIHDTKLERFHENIIKEAAMVGKVLQQKWQKQGSLSLEKKIDMIVNAAKSKQRGSKLSWQQGLGQQKQGWQQQAGWKQFWGRPSTFMTYSPSFM